MRGDAYVAAGLERWWSVATVAHGFVETHHHGEGADREVRTELRLP